MNFIPILTNIRLQDALDILFLTVVAYYLYVWFRETKAFKALAGLLALGLIYTAARSWGLFLTTWMFQILWQVLVILMIILFQSEIRQVLEKVDPLRVMGLRRHFRPEEWIESLTEACVSLATKKIGSLIIIEKTDRVDEFITPGIPVEGAPSPELLLSIFQKESPLHDGAVVIKAGRVVLAASYLPLSPDEGLPKQWGTRHRAALGLSQRCDALAVVVSEERGEVSVARAGEVIHVEDPERLSQVIRETVTPPIHDKNWRQRIRSLLVPRWRLKLGTVATVSIVWLLLAGQQDFEVTLRVPVEVKNLPEQIEIVQPIKPSVKITVRGLRKDASTLSPKNVHVELDLSLAKFGRKTFPASRNQLVLPSERIDVIKIEPTELIFQFKKKNNDQPSR